MVSNIRNGVQLHIGNVIDRTHLRHMIERSYYRLFNLDVIRLMIRHQLYRFTDKRKMYFISKFLFVDNISMSYKFNSDISEFYDFIDVFGDDLKDIMKYVNFPHFYPIVNHSDLSLGDSVSSFITLAKKNIYDINDYDFQKIIFVLRIIWFSINCF